MKNVKKIYEIIMLWFLIFLSTALVTVPSASPNNRCDKEMEVLLMFYNNEDLAIETSSRSPKRISQIPESITVITSDEIIKMNAHSLAEILDGVAGLFVESNKDVISNSLVRIQASEPRHVKFVIDGVTLNFRSNGNAEINTIPVGAIERIEIIKGPASSSWGSSLGGIVNIITKTAGTTLGPTGNISASYGASNSKDYRADIDGKIFDVGYYLFAGHRDSDGLISGRNGTIDNLYSTITIPFNNASSIRISLNGSNTDSNLGQYAYQNFYSKWNQNLFYIASSFEYKPNTDFNLTIQGNIFNQRYSQQNIVLKTDMFSNANEIYFNDEYAENTNEIIAKLNWITNSHNFVFGSEYSYGEIDHSIETGNFLQFFGAPSYNVTRPKEQKYSFFINDTITIGHFSFAPGLRYDHNNISDAILSPSFGVVHKLLSHTLLKASVAKGFTSPPLSWSSGGGLFLAPNPNLKAETVWSYQLGVETSAAEFFDLKVSFFKHDVENEFVPITIANGAPGTTQVVNSQHLITRKGFEADLITKPFYNFYFEGGIAYVNIEPEGVQGTKDVYSYRLSFCYDDKKSFNAKLIGNYMWWGYNEKLPSFDASYSDFIWNAYMTKKFTISSSVSVDIFGTIHNLFNGVQYTNSFNINPSRWAELGCRINF